jgi:LmbE family N-acetylglucosaminyl deacetylase
MVRRMKQMLVIAPHADDEVLGCGGLIAKRAHAVTVAVVALGWPDQPNDIALRADELKQAAAILGVTHTKVLFPGTNMHLDTLPTIALVTAFDALLDEKRYDEVYLPYASTNNDHQIVYRTMLAALRPAARTPYGLVAAYEYAQIGWQVDEVAGGRMYVDISATLGRKLLALEAYTSQLRSYPHPCSSQSVTTLAQWRGLTAGMTYAEMFYVLRLIAE